MKFIYKIVLSALMFNLTSVHSNGQEDDKNKVYFIVEEMPEFQGGEDTLRKYISEEVKYPEIARKNGIQGKVYITFYVDKNGKVTNPKVIRGVDSSLDKEALRVVKGMPDWKPGKEKGEPVNVSFTIPIAFKLDVSKQNHLINERAVTNEEDKEVFYIVEEMPEFPGGEKALKKYIADHTEYPAVAKENGIQGKVFVSFTITKEGTVQDAKVVRGVDLSLDNEALRIVKTLPNFKPGKQRGQAVDVKYTVPVNFELGVQPLKDKLKR